MSYIKGFLSIHSRSHDDSLYDCPVQFTKDNINEKWYRAEFTDKDRSWTLLELVSAYNLKTFDESAVIIEILELGGQITNRVLAQLNPKYYKILLEYGFNPDCNIYDKIPLLDSALSKYASIEEVCLLVDYGAKIPKRWDHIINSPIIRQVEEYASLSDKRVQECKKCMLAMIHACNVSDFRALREILLYAARQVWRLRGGEGCGPRGHQWI